MQCHQEQHHHHPFHPVGEEHRQTQRHHADLEHLHRNHDGSLGNFVGQMPRISGEQQERQHEYRARDGKIIEARARRNLHRPQRHDGLVQVVVQRAQELACRCRNASEAGVLQSCCMRLRSACGRPPEPSWKSIGRHFELLDSVHLMYTRVHWMYMPGFFQPASESFWRPSPVSLLPIRSFPKHSAFERAALGASHVEGEDPSGAFPSDQPERPRGEISGSSPSAWKS